jgi:Protein of unknown function (DUF2783)
MMLNTKPNFTRPDDIYAKLIAAHEGLSEAESHAMNARLILLLMNHIGDDKVIDEALLIASQKS